MEQVPTMISTKDLSYISDMFDWNFIAAKTANHFSEEAQDEQIKEFFENVYESHKTICEKLIECLSMEDNNEQ